MIRRHPHVFGTEAERAAGAEPGSGSGPRPRRKRRTTQRRACSATCRSALPALTRAIKLQNKAAKVGFDWPSLAPVLAKLEEELAELEEAIARRSERGPPASPAIEEEFGDLLFVVANVARHLKIDPEGALRAANEKFIRRFRFIEARLGEQGRSPAQSDLAEMDALWDAAEGRGTLSRFVIWQKSICPLEFHVSFITSHASRSDAWH